MIPRGRPDIGWRDLAAAACYALLPRNQGIAPAVERRWSGAGDALVCLSVRSGFDLLLDALALPAGSEVLVGAITIPDMLLILREHGLVPVPIDLDPRSLQLDLAQAAARVTPRTRALMVTHLFGSRTPLAPAVAFGRRHGLVVIEDAAQAWDGVYHGDPAADCSMFSFGPIKTATTLGGALLRVRDPELLGRMRGRHECYPRQGRRAFARRVLRFGLLKALARPALFGPFVALCRLRGVDHDALINGMVRGFAGPELLPRLRHQPSWPLLRLLHRRLHADHAAAIERRAATGRELARMLGPIALPGSAAPTHSYWVFPLLSADPDGLVRLLAASGWDATRKASSLVAAPAAGEGRDAPRAAALVRQLVYIPLQPGADLRRLAAIIRSFEQRRVQHQSHVAREYAWRFDPSSPPTRTL